MKKLWFFLLLLSCHTMYSAEKKRELSAKKKNGVDYWIGQETWGNFKYVIYKPCSMNTEETMDTEETNADDENFVNSLVIIGKSNIYRFAPCTADTVRHILVDQAIEFSKEDVQAFNKAIKANDPQKPAKLISCDKKHKLIYAPCQGGYACIKSIAKCDPKSTIYCSIL